MNEFVFKPNIFPSKACLESRGINFNFAKKKLCNPCESPLKSLINHLIELEKHLDFIFF